MKNVMLKLVSTLIIVIIGLAIIPMYSKAVDEAKELIILKKSNGEQVIYIKDMDAIDFKYAFSDSDENNLSYTSAVKESNGVNVATLEADKTYKYMFIKEENKNSKVELDSAKIITEDDLKEIESLTKVIEVETAESNSNISKKEDGTTVTKTTGKIRIKADGTYQYEMWEVLDNNNSSKELNQTAVELYDQLSKLEKETNMYSKLQTEITIRDDYKKLLEEAKWEDATNKEIMQPENSQNGEKFVVLIQEVKDGKTVKTDVQFMTTAREDAEDVEYTNTVQTKVIEKKTKLPVTGENLVLYIIFGVVIIAIIVLAIKMKQKGKENEE